MRSSSSKVAGWFVPARGTCSRKLSSPSASIRQTCTPACANASDKQSPTGPAPTTITCSDFLYMVAYVPRTRSAPSPRSYGERGGVRGLRLHGARKLPLTRLAAVAALPRGSPTSPRRRGEVGVCGTLDVLLNPVAGRERDRSILRGHHVLHGADPAGVGEVEHDAERILVLGLVVGVRSGARSRRLRPAGKILATRAHDLLLRFVEVVHPHPEVVDADLLVPFLLEQRDVDGAVGDVEPTPGLARHFHVEGVLEKLGGLFRIGNDERDVAKLGHDLCPS